MKQMNVKNIQRWIHIKHEFFPHCCAGIDIKTQMKKKHNIGHTQT